MGPHPQGRAEEDRARKSLLWMGKALSMEPATQPDWHEHHAVQVTFSVHGSMEVQLEGEPPRRTTGVIIPADHPHRIEADGHMVHLMLDADGALGRAVRHAFSVGMTSEPPPFLRQMLVQRLDFDNPVACIASVERAERRLLAALVHRAGRPPPFDWRVAKTLARMRAEPGTTIPLETLAEGVRLSPSRLRHRFREQVGISMRKFVLWGKCVTAIQRVAAGERISAAAAGAGFADAAHYHRTHRRMFLTRPGDFARASMPQPPQERRLL
ncbi:MAG: helix-turn-helix domain-containing protein [Myxococcota bacterium]